MTTTHQAPIASTHVVTPDRIFEIAQGFMASKHLFAASELGVFEALGEGPVDLDGLAARTGLTRRTARIAADAMVAIGLLEVRGGRYANTPVAATFLSGATPADLLGRGHLAMTVDQGPDMQRYQGVVVLEGERELALIQAAGSTQSAVILTAILEAVIYTVTAAILGTAATVIGGVIIAAKLGLSFPVISFSTLALIAAGGFILILAATVAPTIAALRREIPRTLAVE